MNENPKKMLLFGSIFLGPKHFVPVFHITFQILRQEESQSQPFLPGGFQAARPLQPVQHQQPVQPFQAPPRPEMVSAPTANVAAHSIRPANPFPTAHAEIGGAVIEMLKQPEMPQLERTFIIAAREFRRFCTRYSS